VHTYHGLHYLNISERSLNNISQYVKRKIFKTIDRVLLTYTDRIICVCRSDYDKAIGVGVAHPDRTSIVYNGIELDKFAIPLDRQKVRRLFGIAPTEFIFGNVGRLHEQKGHRFLLHALAKLDHRARLLIVGDGELKAELTTLVAELNIADRVTFLGSRTDIYEFLSAIDVFVMPSLWEGQPIALIEALAIGKPCIATAVDGIPELIDRGVNRYLVAPRSAAELASAMNLTIDRLDQIKPESELSSIEIAAKFSAHNMVEEIANIYIVELNKKSKSSL
jgi:glycosyltransferase involved in cell wall biosynthesis